MLQKVMLDLASGFKPTFLKTFIGFIVLSGLPPVDAAAPTTVLPPILNYHPVCEPTVIKEQSQTRILNNYEDGDTARAESAMVSFLQTLRQKAAAADADALILNEVHSSVEYGERRNSRHRLKIAGSARFIQFCKDNQQLSDRQTHWDEHGAIQSPESTVHRFSLTSSGPEAEVLVLPKLSQDISPATGFFGIQPGMTRVQVEQLIGKADAEIQLQNGLTAHGYGRQLWLIFNDTLLQIQTERRFLSGYGQNLLELHDHFDTNQWLVAGTVKYKTKLADVRLQLPEVTDAGSDQLQLKNQQQQLLLTFEKFNLVHQQPAVSMLTGFILKQAKQKLQPLQLPTVKPELYAAVLQQLQPGLQQSLQWSALTIPPALPQHQLKKKQQQWRILGDYLQLQIEDDQIKKLRIADSIFFRPQQSSIFNELYQALGLPAQKQQLLHMFSDGELYHQQFNLFRDNFHLQISFDTAADDAKPEEVILSYF